LYPIINVSLKVGRIQSFRKEAAINLTITGDQLITANFAKKLVQPWLWVVVGFARVAVGFTGLVSEKTRRKLVRQTTKYQLSIAEQ